MDSCAYPQRSSQASARAFAAGLTTGAGTPRGAVAAIGVVLLSSLLGGCGGLNSTSRDVSIPRSVADVETASNSSAPAAPAPAASAPPTTELPVVANGIPEAPTMTATRAASGPVATRDRLPEIQGRIVRGDPNVARSVAVVDIGRCFEAIPSYRSVRADRSSRDYARYLLSIAEANDEFRDAVESIAIRKGIDLVVEKGALPANSVADITDLVRDRLESPTAALTR